MNRDRIAWILHNNAGDVSYRATIPKLTDEELLHCLKYDTRKSGLRQLRAEALRRRLLEVKKA